MAKRKKIETPEILEDSQDDTTSSETDGVNPEVVADQPAELLVPTEAPAIEAEPVAPKKAVKKAPKVAPKKAPKKAPKDDGLPKVALRVFIASGGIRWDQMAGFKYYATRAKMGPLSIPEWRAAFKKFMKRPV